MGHLLVGLQLEAQVNWFGGGAIGISPQIRRSSGAVGLQTVRDHYWQVGVDLYSKHTQAPIGVGVIGAVQYRSIFYELDRPLPYYPLKAMVPAFRLESVQVQPFISWRGKLRGLDELGWCVRSGPVFGFHGGNYTSVATARKVSDDQVFELYRLGVYRQPMGIPFFRLHAALSYSIKLTNKWNGSIHPFFQVDLGDRSRVWYQVVPDDPLHTGEGWIRTGSGSLGLTCSITRIH